MNLNDISSLWIYKCKVTFVDLYDINEQVHGPRNAKQNFMDLNDTNR